MTVSDLISVVDNYREYVRTANVQHRINQRHGISDNKYVNAGDYINLKFLDKMLQGNLGLGLSEFITYPDYLTEDDFNVFLSNINKTAS